MNNGLLGFEAFCIVASVLVWFSAIRLWKRQRLEARGALPKEEPRVPVGLGPPDDADIDHVLEAQTPSRQLETLLEMPADRARRTLARLDGRQREAILSELSSLL